MNATFFITEIMIVFQFLNILADIFPSYIQMGLFIIWLITLSKNPKMLTACLKLSTVSILIMLVTLFRCAVADKLDLSYFSPMQIVIARYQFIVYPTMFTYIISLNASQKKRLFNIFILSATVTVIVSLYYVLRVDPQAIRNTRGVSYYGVGGFQFVYAIAIFGGPYLSTIIWRFKNNDRCWIDLICFLLMCVCIVLCNLVTSVVILSVSIIFSCFLYSKSLMRSFSAILGGICIILKDYWAKCMRELADKEIFYWSTNKKLYAIANLLSGKNEGLDTLSSRERLTKISLNSFWEHPLFGIDYKNHVAGVVGCHAQWADDLARFGIIGNAVIWINYLYIAKYSLTRCENIQIRHQLLTCWILFFVLGFLNPCLSGTILTIMFVIIPCSDYLYVNKIDVSEMKKNASNCC